MSQDPSLQALAAELADTPYVPLQIIGRGGMGALIEVEHKNLRRKLVMKILRESGRPDLEDRLRVEAHALAQLSHPNVLGIVDFARTPTGRPFLVAERLFGRTLREHLEHHGRLSVVEAVDLTRQALAGLSAAHRLGIVHRDVKLENLFVCDTHEGPLVLKVIDFGIAKIVEAEPGRGLAVEPPMVPTDEGMMMGTPSFMSPEQITSTSVDHRADLYGMGVVLYRLLVGRHPFVCNDALEYARAHAMQIPEPPSKLVPLPPGLDAVVLKALEKRPDDRYATAKDMIVALDPFMVQPLTEVRPASRTVHSEHPLKTTKPMSPVIAMNAAQPNNAAHSLKTTKPMTPVNHSYETAATRIASVADDALPTNPIRKSEPRRSALPIVEEPVFAPVAPPIASRAQPTANREPVSYAAPSRPSMAAPTSQPESDASRLGVHGTFIVSHSLVSPIPTKTETPPIHARKTPRGSREGPTIRSQRPNTLEKGGRDVGLWVAAGVLLAIVLGAVGYVGWLLHAAR